MEVGVEKGWIVVKLEKDEELIPSLVQVMKERGASSGVVGAGIGAHKEFELGWFDPLERSYSRRRYETSHEILSLQGTVTLDSDPPIHVHCSLSDEEHRVVGGHVFEGKVSVLAEVAMLALEEVSLTRKTNPETGLRELTIREQQSTK
jgi:predicted DNA-binding protein with PD1-like motif